MNATRPIPATVPAMAIPAPAMTFWSISNPAMVLAMVIDESMSIILRSVEDLVGDDTNAKLVAAAGSAASVRKVLNLILFVCYFIC